jgi:N-acetylneuraminic acid mutarotase
MTLNFKNSQLYLLFIVIFIINNAFTDPNISRYAAVSVVTDNQLYIIGGYSIELGSFTDSFFYVNLTNNFNITNVPWVEGNKTPVRTAWGVGAVGGSNKSIIFIIGGIMVNSTTNIIDKTSLIYTYDVNEKVWNIPKTTGISPDNIQENSIVVDNKGRIYIFGGGGLSTESTYQNFNDMYTLNTVDLTWGKLSTINPPSPTLDHTSTLLPDGRIVIIGGRDGTTTLYEVDMYQV